MAGTLVVDLIGVPRAFYLQSADPAVANPTHLRAGIHWIDTSSSPFVWKKRNADNDGWDTLGKIRTDAEFNADHLAMALGDRHAPHNWEYADAAAREAATGFTPDDVGNVALQLDDFSRWTLTDDDPATWVSVSAGPHVAAHENGGSDEMDVTGLSGLLADPQTPAAHTHSSADIADFGANVASFLVTPSSANLAAALTDETGSGAAVFATSPTLVTPALGTPASGNLSNCTADGTNGVGFKNIPQNSQSAAYTTVLGDAGKHIFHPSSDANARTFTIDSNANVAYPIGTAITFINMTSQVVTIAITSDTLRLAGTGATGSRSLAQYGVATAIKIGSTEWLISGTGLT